MSNKQRLNFIDLVRSPKAITGISISLVGIYWAFKDFNFITHRNPLRVSCLYYILSIERSTDVSNFFNT